MPTIGVFAAIFDSAGRILLVRRAYPPYGWTTPGGRMEECESIAAAAAREVLEETGLTIQPGGVIGVYSAPFKNDVVIFVAAEVTGRGAWSPNGEIDCQAYFARDELPEPLKARTRVRILDAFEGRTGVMRVFEPDGT